MISDLPPTILIDDASIYCSVEAAARYFLPSEPVYAVVFTEGGRPGVAVENTNGTCDLGYMQFNTAYLKTLSHAGVKASDVQKKQLLSLSSCRVAQKGHLEERSGADVLTSVAWYHSGSITVCTFLVNVPPIEAGASCFNENSTAYSEELRRLTLSPQASIPVLPTVFDEVILPNKTTGNCMAYVNSPSPPPSPA